MARPARFDEAQILDAALGVLAERGVRGVSVAAIARVLGAPSGSLYHRFPSRDRLLAAMWLRSAARFQDGYIAALKVPDDAVDGVEAGARFVVAWCRANPQEGALLLQYRREDLLDGPWPDALVQQAHRLARQLDDATNQLAARLSPVPPVDLSLLRLAAISIPEGAVRPYLRARTSIPPHLDDAVARASRAVLVLEADSPKEQN